MSTVTVTYKIKPKKKRKPEKKPDTPPPPEKPGTRPVSRADGPLRRAAGRTGYGKELCRGRPATGR